MDGTGTRKAALNGQVSATMPSANGADEGEAVPKLWFVVKTRMHGERQMAKRLASCGAEVFLPVQKEWHQWSDRRKQVARLVIPMLVFVRLGIEERKELTPLLSLKFLADSTRNNKPAVIPDIQMQWFMFMLSRSESEVQMETATIHVGDCVRVTGGCLAGLVGHVAEDPQGRTKVVIRIGNLGCASVEVAKDSLQVVQIEEEPIG